jgi:hypothetical protein
LVVQRPLEPVKEVPMNILRNSIAVALALTASVAVVAAGPDRTGTCVHATIPGTVVLPGGEVATGPELRLCYTKLFSPVAGLHEASVDGRPIGLFTSTRGVSEGSSPLGRALIVLRRGPGDVLTLHAYAVQAGDRMVTYRFGERAGPHSAAGTGFDLTSWITDRPEEFTIVAALP